MLKVNEIIKINMNTNSNYEFWNTIIIVIFIIFLQKYLIYKPTTHSDKLMD